MRADDPSHGDENQSRRFPPRLSIQYICRDTILLVKVVGGNGADFRQEGLWMRGNCFWMHTFQGAFPFLGDAAFNYSFFFGQQRVLQEGGGGMPIYAT